VDPGTYSIRATAPGKPAWTKQLDVLRGSVSVTIASRTQNASVPFIIGGAAIAAGAVLWFTAPEPERSARSRRGVGLVPFGVRGVW
jgi:hypothetical protein